MPDPDTRDVAVVLSGGGINGVLLELGFPQRGYRLADEVLAANASFAVIRSGMPAGDRA